MHLKDEGFIDVFSKYPHQVIQESLIQKVCYLSDPELFWSSATGLFHLSEDYMTHIFGLTVLKI